MNRSEGTICRGELRLFQPHQGYRFNVDSLILADFAQGWLPEDPEGRTIDLGAGCGVIGLLLARRCPDRSITLVEIQKELANLACHNARENGLEERVDVLSKDLRELESCWDPPPGLIVCNPPFYRVGTGRLNPNPQAAMARHELAGTLDEICQCAGRLLGRGGKFCLVHIMERKGEVLTSLTCAGLQPRIFQRILATPGHDALRFLIMAERHGGTELEELPPLVERERPGVYTREMKQILREDDNAGGGK